MTSAALDSHEAKPKPGSAKQATTRRQIRGSSMLFAGRLMSMAINLGVHVLIVRYLSKSDYGAFAYAMSLVNLGRSVADFGLHRAVSRFVPIYQEQQEHQKLLGTLMLSLVTICGIGFALALGVYCFQGYLAQTLIRDQQAVYLLLILVFMSPVEAIDRMLVNLFAIFASPRAIFFRRYVVGPALKVIVVGLLIGGQFSVRFLAAGYLAAAVVGVTIYSGVLLRLLRKEGLLQHFSGGIAVPWREVLFFTVPLLSSDLLHIFMNGMDALMLGYFNGAESVAAIRAIRPTAVLNQIVFTSFAILYTPQAARLFARKDGQALNDLYWQTATWIAVLSFPVFLLTFSLAQPLTELLFGARYEQSGMLLCLLSLGYYIQAAFGFNGTTLTIYRRVGWVAMMNVAVAVASIGLNLWLIPRYGALGAAMAGCSVLILHNLFKQAALVSLTDVQLFNREYLRVYLMLACGALIMFSVQWLLVSSVVLNVLMAALIFVFTLRLNRDLLDVEQTFPELMRLPLMPLLLGKTASPKTPLSKNEP